MIEKVEFEYSEKWAYKIWKLDSLLFRELIKSNEYWSKNDSNSFYGKLFLNRFITVVSKHVKTFRKNKKFQIQTPKTCGGWGLGWEGELEGNSGGTDFNFSVDFD